MSPANIHATQASCHCKTCSLCLSLSPLNKKDHVTDGKIFFDCFIKRPYKINKTKFEINKKKRIYTCPFLYGRNPQKKVTKMGWNAVGVMWLGFQRKLFLEEDKYREEEEKGEDAD